MDLVNLVKFCLTIFKTMSKKQIMVSIKGRYSAANLRKVSLYDPNVDLVNDNVGTKFVKILSIHS